jgi:predicted TIM-barrel fold metal-dependent hydrolase
MFALRAGQPVLVLLVLLSAMPTAAAADAPADKPAAKNAAKSAAEQNSQPVAKVPEPTAGSPSTGPADTAPAATDAAETVPLDGRAGRDLALDHFRPRSMLQVAEHHLERARFPVVDVHFHPRVRFHENRQMLDDFVKVMDRQNIAVCVSLDGQMGESFLEHRHYLWDKYRDRFVIFANIDWRGDGKPDEPATWDCQRPDFGRRMARQLAETKTEGACGLKVFKDFGLVYRNPDGTRIRIDDPRWDPIWAACGELGMPVLIHVADPAAFFLPIDETNERWEELRRHPDWSFAGPDGPSREALLDALLTIVARHPKTNFIGAHVASNAEDLATVGRWLDEHPNLYLDIAARIAELGRQPVTARKFLIDYADRVLFGTDGPRVADRLLLHWRFMETSDEYFPYAENAFPPQGFWRIYGVDLPDDVLKKIYFQNAERLISGVRERVEKYQAAVGEKREP